MYFVDITQYGVLHGCFIALMERTKEEDKKMTWTCMLYSRLPPGLAFSLTLTSETKEHNSAHVVYRWFRNNMRS